MAKAALEATLEWTGGLRFTGRAGDCELVLDGDREAGCSPMDALALSLAGCMGIDVVHILGKMRAAVKTVRVEIRATRAEEEPRRFTAIRLDFEVSGDSVESRDLERAIQLSREKYCSVYHSLRPDIDFSVSCRLT